MTYAMTKQTFPVLLRSRKSRRRARRELIAMLSYKRPGGSKTEHEFIERYIAPLGVEVDGAGNLWKDVGEGPQTILWSCHTDTVHRAEGRQRLGYIERDDLLCLMDSKDGCLGADCTTGVWIMRHMIIAGIPGRYVFHREEETGGVGSRHVAAKEAERLEGIKFAIAFDRKGQTEIITHQGTRTASDAFAWSLAQSLEPLRLEPSDRGTFTDTANYTDLVPECTNIAVGYMGQHTERETQHLGFAMRLLRTILNADFSGLVCERKPGDDFSDWPWSGPHAGFRAGSGSRCARWTDLEMERYVYDNPEIVAEFLEAQGFTLADLKDWAKDMEISY